MTLGITGTDAAEYDGVFHIQSPNSFENYVIMDFFGSAGPTKVPVLSSATFSLTGRSLVVKFDSDTDRGLTSAAVSLASFACDALFTFTGASDSSCIFTSDLTVKVTFPVSTSSSSVPLVSIGDPFVLKANVIQAACVGDRDCSAYPYSTAVLVSVAPPDPSSLSESAVILAPVISLQAPYDVTVRDDLTLTYASSQGGAGREWAAIEWSVESEGGAAMTAMTAELNANTVSTNSYQILPKSFLIEGVYTILLKLTNFLGYSGYGSVTVRVFSNTSASPLVVISGVDELQTLRPHDSVHLQGVVTPAPSVGSGGSDNSSALRFTYTWNIYENGVLSSAIHS